jgi:hypothetical protein
MAMHCSNIELEPLRSDRLLTHEANMRNASIRLAGDDRFSGRALHQSSWAVLVTSRKNCSRMFEKKPHWLDETIFKSGPLVARFGALSVRSSDSS